MIGVKRQDGIKLRFGVKSPDLAEAISKSGLMLERADADPLLSNHQLEFKQLGIQKLMARENWPKVKKKDTSYLASAYGLLYLQKKGNSDEESQLKWTILTLLSNYSWEVAEKLGYGLTDLSVDLSQSYVYRIYHPSRPDLDTVYYKVEGKIQDVVSGPQIDSVSVGEKAIQLHWKKDQDSTFIAFNIERSNYPEGPFTKINEAPFMDFEGADTTLSNSYDDASLSYNKRYWYRIQAINCFGELTQYSKTVEVELIDQTPPAPALGIVVEFPNNSQTIVRWKYPHPMEKGLNFSVLLGKEGQKANEFKLITPQPLSANQRSLEINEVSSHGSYFIVLTADSLGNSSMTLPVFAAPIDSTPPTPPVFISGVSDSLGNLEVHWIPNEEPDLKGYRIFMANDSNHVFTQLSDTVFDSIYFHHSVELNSLTEDIFFRLVAVDIHNNHSNLSRILHIKLPDTLAPSPAIFNEYRVEENGINLQFYPPFDLDVASVSLIRQDLESQQIDTLKKYSGPFKERRSIPFTDVSAVVSRDYLYTLVTTDDDGNLSYCPADLELSMIDKKTVPTVSRLVNKDEKDGILLSWSNMDNGASYYILLKKEDHGSFITYKRLAVDETTFLDKEVQPKHTYQYGIVVEDMNGNRSKLIKGDRVLKK
ncbi:MAG: hypothetical protein AAFY71_24600 [Bacteroidota bacterium]